MTCRLVISLVETFSVFQAKILAFSSVLRLVGAIWTQKFRNCSTSKRKHKIWVVAQKQEQHTSTQKGSSKSIEDRNEEVVMETRICQQVEGLPNARWIHSHRWCTRPRKLESVFFHVFLYFLRTLVLGLHLLGVVGKVSGRVLIKRFREGTEGIICEEQGEL